MLIIGVVGGIASGKTIVAAELGRLGASVLDADGAGHTALRQPEARQAIVARWGKAVLDGHGHVDRKRVSQIVFGLPPSGPRELQFLEQVIHPRIEIVLQRQIAGLVGRGVVVAVLDAAVMIKAGWDRWCDRVVFVDAPREIRMVRCRQRGWTEQEFALREAAQESLELKRARADVIIDNSGSIEATRRQVERVWRELVLAAAPPCH